MIKINSTKNAALTGASVLAVLFASATPAFAGGNSHNHNSANANPCVLGSGAQGQCSGAMRVTEQVMITSNAPVQEMPVQAVQAQDYSYQSNYQNQVEYVNGPAAAAPAHSCAQMVVQRVPCNGQWATVGNSTVTMAPAAVSYAPTYAQQHSGHMQHNVPHGYARNSAPIAEVPHAHYNNGHPSHSEHMNGNHQHNSHQHNGHQNGGHMQSGHMQYNHGSNAVVTNNYAPNFVPAAPSFVPASPMVTEYPVTTYNPAPTGYAPNNYVPSMPQMMPQMMPTGYAPNNYAPAPMVLNGLPGSFFYGGITNGAGFNMQTGYGGGGSFYSSGGSRFSGINGGRPPSSRVPPSSPNPPPPPPPPPQ